MKNNLIVNFEIDYEVKIYLDNQLLGSSGYQDIFKTNIESDGLLTLKKGTKKASIRVYKDKVNKIDVGYSTTGQLKATYVSDGKTLNKATKRDVKSESVKEEIKDTNNVPENNLTAEDWVKGIGGLILIGISIFSLYSIFVEKGPSISGCYYIQNHILSNSTSTPSLCFNGKKVTLTYLKNKYEYSASMPSDSIYVENEYNETVFRCNVNENDSKSIKCFSNLTSLGTGSYVWTKK